ncbi:MAG: V-type ATP synthase subunit I [bacterium]
MAIVPMTKVGILTHKSDFETVTAKLGELGIVQISEPDSFAEDSGWEIEDLITRIRRACDLNESFLKKIPPRLKLTALELRALIDSTDIEEILAKIDSDRHNLEEAKSRALDIKKALNDISPYSKLPYRFEDLRNTTQVGIKLGYIPKVVNPESLCEEKAKELNELIELKKISDDVDGSYVIIFYHKTIDEEIEKQLADCDFAEFHPHGFDEQPSLEIKKLKTELAEVEAKIDKAIAHFKDTAGETLPKLRAIEGFYRAEMAERRLKDIASSTDQTLYLTGWTKEKDLGNLREKISGELATMVEVINPDEKEAPPVALKNPPVIEAFEVITDLYGRPRPGMVDPTPFIAPFFPLFFALCLTDAGYGLLLALLGGGFLAFGKLGAGARKFMRFILYSGIATVVVGALAGGWFGIDLKSMDNSIAHALLSVKLFDPLDNAIEFFAASIFLGVIQVSVGFVISGYVGAKESPNAALKVRAVLLALSWIAVTLGAGIFIANFLVPEFMAPFTSIGTAGLKYGALGIVGFSLVLGIAGKRGIGASLGDGLAFDGLYGIVNLFGDLLSYARILALGLSTGVIAGVINIIAGQLVEMIPGVGIVIAGMLVLVGHVAYTGLSALGAFVHPARLHFVEYFTKFYEAGGEPFAPYTRKVDGVEIVE